MAEAVAERVVSRLSPSALKEIREARGFMAELQQIKNKVSDFKDKLPYAEKRQAEDRAVQDWLGKAKDVIYDAEDLLDTAFAEDLRSKVMTCIENEVCIRLFPKSNPLAHHIKIGRCKRIMDKLERVTSISRSIRLEEHPVETRVWNKMRETDSFVDEAVVIGREEDRENIIHRLFEEPKVSIISIVGIGGVGKTQVAQMVYNDHRVKRRFALRMWVSLSNMFDPEKIVKAIITSATNKFNPENLGMDKLQTQLVQEINHRRFLLVLDDMWDDDFTEWHRLVRLLMCGAKGSSILITTRNSRVAKFTGRVQQHVLTAMKFEDSWSLFKKIAFKHGQEPQNSRILSIGKEIVKKCTGHPLSIKAIAGTLYKHSQNDWLFLKNIAKWEAEAYEYNVLPALNLSYIHLPSHLRPCFTYCALLPKDHKIDVQTLIYLWVAQGFIRSSDTSRLEDVGYEYFMDLLDRSFFQEVEKDEWGNIKSCKMHEAMHDLACSVARVESTLLYPDKENIDKNIRHISFGFNLDSSWQISSSLHKANRIRTFLLPSQSWVSYEEKLKKSTCDAIVSTFKCLRALDLHNLGIVVLPTSIGKLEQLRYLDLSGNGIERLPRSINKLKKLQTLKLSYCRELKELPKDIEKLECLRNLVIDGCNNLTHLPRGLGELKSLRTLTQFVVSKGGGLRELGRLNSLRGELEILHLQHSKDSTLADLKGKTYLQQLSLEWGDEADDYEKSLTGLQPHSDLKGLRVRGFKGVRFIPSWLINIVKFTLYNCPKCEYLPKLHRFPSLKILELLRLNALKNVSDSNPNDEHSEFFPSLTELKLWDCPNLKGWWKSDFSGNARAPFPSISKLEIMYCPELTSIPTYPNLEEQLILSGTKAKSLLETVMNVAGPITEVASTSSSTLPSSSFSPLSKLRLLRIEGSKELESLPEEWLRNLTSLQRLDISECSKLESLSNGIQHLASLQTLETRDCEALTLCNDEDDGMQWQYLKSLRSLTIWGIPNLSSLPAGLQRVSSLETLNLSNCQSLVALPEWIGSLASLRRLVLSKCRNLGSLPQGISKLTALRRLVIDDCPILLKRCQRETGEDWPKIAHIPSIEENATYVDFD